MSFRTSIAIAALALVAVGCAGRVTIVADPSPVASPSTSLTIQGQASFPAGIKPIANIPVSIPHMHMSGQEFQSLDWSPTGQEIAYTWLDGLWIGHEPEFTPKKLTSIPKGHLGELAYSPDGLRIAFRGEQLVERDGLEGEFVWVIGADGTELANLTHGLDPFRGKFINQWRDDHRLTFSVWMGTGAQDLEQADLLTGDHSVLMEQSPINVQSIGGTYYWSPDREYIAVQGCCTKGILVVRAAKIKETKKLPGYEQVPAPAFQGWLPDGHRFLFTRWGEPPESYPSLWLWDIDRWEGREILDHVYAAAPSPNGSRVAVLRQEDRQWQPPAGDKLRPAQLGMFPALTLGTLELATGKTTYHGAAGYKRQEPSGDRYWQLGRPVWSPDSKLLIYWSEQGEVHLLSADDGWQERLIQGPEIVQVLWSPDGRKIALRSFDQAWIIEKPSR